MTVQCYRGALTIALIMGHVLLASICVRLLTVVDIPKYLWPRWQSICIESLALSQTGLVAVWLAIGSLALPLRISGCVIVVGMWLLILQYSGLNHEHWRLLLLLQVSGIGISLHFMADSWELQLADQSSSPDKEFRFTLREMFGWFTAAASVLAFSSIVWQTSSAAKLPGFGETPRAAAFGLLLIPVACVSTWAVLLSSRRLLPLCSTLLAVTLVSLLVGLVDQSVRRTWWSSLDRMAYTKAYWCVIFLHSATLYASLGCVRGAGYCLVKNDRTASSVEGSRGNVIQLFSRQYRPLWIGISLLLIIFLTLLRQFFACFWALTAMFAACSFFQAYRRRQDVAAVIVCVASVLVFVPLVLYPPGPVVPINILMVTLFPVIYILYGLPGVDLPAVCLLVGLSLGNGFVLVAPFRWHHFSRHFPWYCLATACCAILSWSLPFTYPRLVTTGPYHSIWCVLQTIIPAALLVGRYAVEEKSA